MTYDHVVVDSRLSPAGQADFLGLADSKRFADFPGLADFLELSRNAKLGSSNIFKSIATKKRSKSS